MQRENTFMRTTMAKTQVSVYYVTDRIWKLSPSCVAMFGTDKVAYTTVCMCECVYIVLILL